MKRATLSRFIGFNSVNISIHALVKRATYPPSVSVTVGLDFNPRPREEGDAVAHTGTVSDVDFNPRPREEGDSGTCSL